MEEMRGSLIVPLATMEFVPGLLNLRRWFFPTLADMQKRVEMEDETKRKEFEFFERKVGEARLAFDNDRVDFYIERTRVANFRADLGSKWTEFKMRLKDFIEHDIFGKQMDFWKDFLEQQQLHVSLLHVKKERLFEALDVHVKQAFKGCDLDWVSDLAGDMNLEASHTVLHCCRNLISMKLHPVEDYNDYLGFYNRTLNVQAGILMEFKEAHLRPMDLKSFEAYFRAVLRIFEVWCMKRHNACLTELEGLLMELKNRNRDFEHLQRQFEALKEEIENNQSELNKSLKV